MSIRSALYMPGSNQRALQKSLTLEADAFIFDLEDAVVPDAKPDARTLIFNALQTGDFKGKQVVIRTNAAPTPYWEADWELLKSIVNFSGVCGVLVPKIETVDDVISAHTLLDQIDPTQELELWVMMETPRAVANALALADTSSNHPRLSCFVIGTNDLAKDTGVEFAAGREFLMPWLMTIMAAAKANGLMVLDGVYNAISDHDGFDIETQQARKMGMDGKTLIHPSQIAPCNMHFSPSKEEIRWAKAVVTAFAQPENARVGVVLLEGQMVERLHLEMAQKTLSISDG